MGVAVKIEMAATRRLSLCRQFAFCTFVRSGSRVRSSSCAALYDFSYRITGSVNSCAALYDFYYRITGSVNTCAALYDYSFMLKSHWDSP